MNIQQKIKRFVRVISSRVRDSFNEVRIFALLRIMTSCTTREARAFYWDRLSKAIRSRSPEQVLRMELKGGLK